MINGQIFISYRREESRWSARSLCDRLVMHFGRNQIFMDVDTLQPGVDFVEAIEESVGSCNVLIAVIGEGWLTSTDERGLRRLDDPEDFVRMEIATALRRKIRVIPVLVDGASMPRSDEVPNDLKPLIRRNALSISEASFDDDCRRLIAAIQQVFEETRAERPGRDRARERQPETSPEIKAASTPTVRKGRNLATAVKAILGLLIFLAIGAAVYFGYRGLGSLDARNKNRKVPLSTSVTIDSPADSFPIPTGTEQMLQNFPASRILLNKRFRSKHGKAEYAAIVVDVRGLQPGDAASKAIPFPSPGEQEHLERDQPDERDMDAVKIEGPGYTRYLKRTYSDSAPLSILWEFKWPDGGDRSYHDVYRQFKSSLLIQ